MIIDEFKKANVEAMKARDMVTKNIIGVVVNKYMLLSIEKKAVNTEATDADMIAIIQKTIKELTEEAENYKKANNAGLEADALKQRAFIERFLPQMMSADEIKAVILAQDDKSVPNIMRLFKSGYAGKCDMRLVGEVLKSL